MVVDRWQVGCRKVDRWPVSMTPEPVMSLVCGCVLSCCVLVTKRDSPLGINEVQINFFICLCHSQSLSGLQYVGESMREVCTSLLRLDWTVMLYLHQVQIHSNVETLYITYKTCYGFWVLSTLIETLMIT